ncbi:MAG: dUTP diphosphatase [Ruminococcaceae bacterium]|nr:dUTP diphosphatase [Oscillospiraceae bacterium]
MKTDVKILLSRGMTMPAYATEGAAAVDMRAAIDEGTTVTIEPGCRAMIPTGMAIALENANVVAILAARSGLAVKSGINLANGIGVIDSDYRGEICVGLYNSSNVPFTVNRGDRIAQLMFMPVYTANLIEAETLDETARGAGGFGSTGVK